MNKHGGVGCGGILVVLVLVSLLVHYWFVWITLMIVIGVVVVLVRLDGRAQATPEPPALAPIPDEPSMEADPETGLWLVTYDGIQTAYADLEGARLGLAECINARAKVVERHRRRRA